MIIPELKTERLILRAFSDNDLDAYADMCGNAEVMRYLGGQPLSRAEAWRNMAMIVGHWQLRGYGMWATQERSTGEMIGRVGCWQPEGWPGFEIGWTLRQAYWGYGYATEAARASMDYAFTSLKQPHVISLINPDNLASRRVAERLGQTIARKTELLGIQVLIYKITRETWLKEKS